MHLGIVLDLEFEMQDSPVLKQFHDVGDHLVFARELHAQVLDYWRAIEQPQQRGHGVEEDRFQQIVVLHLIYSGANAGKISRERTILRTLRLERFY